MKTITELVAEKHLFLIRSTYPEYDTATHVVNVMEYALQNDCMDSLYAALNRLCCNDDEVIILTGENPYNFFWFLVSRKEFDAEMERVRFHTEPKPVFELRKDGKTRYHGGLIGHVVYKDGEPTKKLDWSIHT